jgi:hypothetical protein
VLGLFFGPALASGSLVLIAATLCIAMIVLGFVNAPLAAWLARLFPVQVRYSGVAFAFNIGGIVGGALTPIAAQMLSAAGATKYSGLLLTAVGLLTFCGLRFARPVDDR